MTDGLPRTLRNDEQKLRKKKWFSWLTNVGAGIKSKFDQYAEAQQRLRDQSDIWFRESDEEEENEENQQYQPITHLFHQNYDKAEETPVPSAKLSTIPPDVSDFSGNYSNIHEDTLTLDQNPLVESTTNHELAQDAGNVDNDETAEFISAIESENDEKYDGENLEVDIDEEGEIDEEDEIDEENEIDEEGEIDEENGIERDTYHDSPPAFEEVEDPSLDYDPEKSDHTLWSEVGFDGYDHTDEAINREVNETPNDNFESHTSTENTPEAIKSQHEDERFSEAPELPLNSSRNDGVHITNDNHKTNLGASSEKNKDLSAENNSDLSNTKSESVPKIYQALNAVNVGFDFGPTYPGVENKSVAADTSNESHAPLQGELDVPANSTDSPSVRGDIQKSTEEPNKDAPHSLEKEEDISIAEPSYQGSSNPLNEQSFGDWNLFDVGFTVAPDPDASIQVKSLQDHGNASFESPHDYTFDQSFDFPEPEANIFDHEVRLQARMAHRLLSNSTLFGGTKAVKRKAEDHSNDVEKEHYNEEVETRKSIKTARNLFSQSSLFGGNPKRQKIQNKIPEITRDDPHSPKGLEETLKSEPPRESAGNRRRRAKPHF